MKVLLTIFFSIFIAIFTYILSENKKNMKAIVAACIVAVLSFSGQTIIDSFSIETDEKNDDSEEDQTVEEKNNKNENKENENKSVVENNTETIVDAEESDKGNDSQEIRNRDIVQFLGEKHEPSDTANQVSVTQWEPNVDQDISGKTYSGGLKISISNIFAALEGNTGNTEKEIISEMHYAFNEESVQTLSEDERYFIGKFVIAKDVNGSSSTVVISILLDGDEVYNSGEVNAYSVDIPPFKVNFSDKKELVIRTVCKKKGTPFVYGMVNNE